MGAGQYLHLIRQFWPSLDDLGQVLGKPVIFLSVEEWVQQNELVEGQMIESSFKENCRWLLGVNWRSHLRPEGRRLLIVAEL